MLRPKTADGHPVSLGQRCYIIVTGADDICKPVPAIVNDFNIENSDRLWFSYLNAEEESNRLNRINGCTKTSSLI